MIVDRPSPNVNTSGNAPYQNRAFWVLTVLYRGIDNQDMTSEHTAMRTTDAGHRRGLAYELASASRYVSSVRSVYWRELQFGVPSTLIRAFLVAGINPGCPDAQHTPPLIFVADQGSVALANLLIQAGANVNATNAHGVSPLMIAAMEKHEEMMRTLLEAGADLEQKDDRGLTALMKAANYGNYEAVEFLLIKGADVMAKTKQGKTALYYATDPEVRALLERAKMTLVRAKRTPSKGTAPA